MTKLEVWLYLDLRGMLLPLAAQLTCKAALKTICTASVRGLPHLEAALEGSRSNGVITVANHISTLDDPLVWGAIPTKYFLKRRTTRWTLGASDVMFTNPLFSAFFRHGNVLETFRGMGIYQPSVDAAIRKLNEGNWVHFFSEGKIHQHYPVNDDGLLQLPRFKWGVGRVLMEVSALPVILPMWLSGFEHLMPEGRAFPYKYLPRPGTQLGVVFGQPIDLAALEALRATSDGTDAAARSAITAVLHDAVEALGRSIPRNESLS